MAWTVPRTWAVGDPGTSSDLNVYVRDNTSFLYGDTAWTTVLSFNNGWSAGAITPRYRRTGTIVEINGSVTGGTLALNAFVLPAGPPSYRPTAQVHKATSSNNAFGMFFVDTGGNVIPQVGSTTAVFLDCTFGTL